MNAADKIAATTRRLRETRAEIERASAAPRLVTRVAATTATERLRDQHRAALALVKATPFGPARQAARARREDSRHRATDEREMKLDGFARRPNQTPRRLPAAVMAPAASIPSRRRPCPIRREPLTLWRWRNSAGDNRLGVGLSSRAGADLCAGGRAP